MLPSGYLRIDIGESILRFAVQIVQCGKDVSGLLVSQIWGKYRRGKCKSKHARKGKCFIPMCNGAVTHSTVDTAL